MNDEQLDRIRNGPGFCAALDQSGGSTPRALALYGVNQDAYDSDEEMFDLMHAMRSRIMTSPSFSEDRILAAILFADTIERDVAGLNSTSYLWEVKHIVPFLKVDKGLADEQHGAQMMRPIPDLGQLLSRAQQLPVFGTKMRSFIKHPDPVGVKEVVDQQFEFARPIMAAGLVPILEPEVDIRSDGRADTETLLKLNIVEKLEHLASGQWVILKLSLPVVDDFYRDLVQHPNVLRVLALSGGYARQEAVAILARDHGVIASFSRALTEGLSGTQDAHDFDSVLDSSIQSIFTASQT
jgi:fructose-bisphosphate aldolase class I